MERADCSEPVGGCFVVVVVVFLSAGKFCNGIGGRILKRESEPFCVDGFATLCLQFL
jgi:hypothetical protein